ncbi:hypothetical protein ACFL3H_06735 [Gemmatimonadota bacterium]
MKRLVPLLSCSIILILTLSPTLRAQIGPTMREILPDPPRFILQVGGNLGIPVGDLGASDYLKGGFATQGFGLECRGYAALTKHISIFAGYSRPRFSYDKTMLEDQFGLEIEDPKLGFSTIHTGVRFLMSDANETISYLQGSVGKYQFESQATDHGDPIVGSVDPELGYSFGFGIMNRHVGPGFDMTFAIHFTDVTFPNGFIRFPNGYTMKARWISCTIMTGLGAGSVK